MTLTFHVPGPLLAFTGGRGRLQIEGSANTVVDALALLFARHPGLRDRVMDERGGLRRHVNVFVGSESIRDRNGLETPIGDNVEVSIIPAISGGRVPSA